MSDIAAIVCILLSGMGLGWLGRRNAPLLRLADAVASRAVLGLLFLLGAGLGSDDSLFTRLPELGGIALCIAVCSCAGSVLFLSFLQPFFTRSSPERRPFAPAEKNRWGPLWGTARILACFAAGMALARWSLIPGWLLQDRLVTYALWLLVGTVGIGLGAEFKAFGILRELHMRILAVPALVAAGTGAGAAAAAWLLPDTGLRDALAAGAGFGYYSLSSLLIEQMGDSRLAAVALLSNIFRELLAILGAPVLTRLCGSLAPVAAAGATAMDTGLPMIARYAGERAAIVAVFSGMSLTLLVPFLVVGIMRW